MISTERKPYAESAVNGKPLFVAKFNHNNVRYKDSLQQTIKAAQNKNKNFLYEVVAVTPLNASGDTQNLARNQAAQIFEEMTKIGVSPEKIDLLSKSNERATGAEVQIFVK